MKPNEYKLRTEKKNSPVIWRWIEGDIRYPFWYLKWKHQKGPIMDVRDAHEVLSRHDIIKGLLELIHDGHYEVCYKDGMVSDVIPNRQIPFYWASNYYMVSHMTAHCLFSVIVEFLADHGIPFEDRFVWLLPDSIVQHSVYSSGKIDIDDYLRRIQIGLNTIFIEYGFRYRIIRYNKPGIRDSYVSYPMGVRYEREYKWRDLYDAFEIISL